MKEQPAPTDNLGLVKLPRMRDCVGQECPVALKKGRCFTDWHHLYHPFGKFATSGALIKSFHDDRHNLVPMARCRHNSTLKNAQHNKYGYALIPPVDVMATFLDESAILADLGVTVKNMARIVRSLTAQNNRDRAKNPERSLDWLMLFQDKLHGLQSQAANFEVVPGLVVEQAYSYQRSNVDIVNAAGFSGLNDVSLQLVLSN